MEYEDDVITGSQRNNGRNSKGEPFIDNIISFISDQLFRSWDFRIRRACLFRFHIDPMSRQITTMSRSEVIFSVNRFSTATTAITTNERSFFCFACTVIPITTLSCNGRSKCASYLDFPSMASGEWSDSSPNISQYWYFTIFDHYSSCRKNMSWLGCTSDFQIQEDQWYIDRLQEHRFQGG